ncbi:MAG: DUF5103 domain-containing protein, partial [Ignavibacteriales bacterium]|nr:DUF5103 domain-containing protein [Ignavibacteriales bacterium]
MIRTGIVLGVVIFLAIVGATAQEILSPRLKGLRLYGSSEADLPILKQRSGTVTLEFDITDSAPPNLQLIFVHCDRNWMPTQTPFVNDEVRLKTRGELPFVPAPHGVHGYGYQYRILIPEYPSPGTFTFSGNYIVEIMDQDINQLLGRARFFVVESLVKPEMRVTNRRDPGASSPWNQVNQISVSFRIPPQDSSAGPAFFSTDFGIVDIYRNREVTRRWRIDSDDRDANTFVDGLGTSRLRFRIDNVFPGNEYRVFDIRNVDQYPQDRPARLRGGADV